MFNIDLSSKRARLALRFFTYGVMTLATVLLTAVAVFYAMGYRFNQNDLSFEQGGLLQLRSMPEGAHVVVDGAVQNFTTPGRINLGAGTHRIEMQLAGYRSWQKTVSVAPGQLLWLDYTRLLPESITTTAAANFDSLAGALATPDRKWMVVQPKADQPQLKLVDLNDPKKPATTDFTIPEAQLTKKDGVFGTFAVKEWDLGSRYLLVEHTNKDVHELLRLDREHPANAINVSRTFSLNIAEAHFAGSNANVLYAKTDNVLRSLDIGASSASAALITGVEQFVVYGNDTVAFVANRDGAQRVVGIFTKGKESIARTYNLNTPATIAYAEYAHHAYLAITNGDMVARIYRDPTASTKDNAQVAEITLSKAVAWLKFSGSGRMLAAGNGNDVATYDLELDTTTAWAISGAAVTHPLQWLDDYYLWSDAGSSLRIFEFDSNNDRDITAVEPGFIAGLSQDGAYLFSFAKAANGGFQLQSSQIVKN